MLDSCKMVEKQSEAFHTFQWHFFSSLKQNFIAYRSSKVSSRPDCIFEIHQLWQSEFTWVYSNCCSSCSFEAEIIKFGQSSHKMYSNNIVNFQESTTILNACTKESGNLLNAPRITPYSIVFLIFDVTMPDKTEIQAILRHYLKLCLEAVPRIHEVEVNETISDRPAQNWFKH